MGAASERVRGDLIGAASSGWSLAMDKAHEMFLRGSRHGIVFNYEIVIEIP